MSARACSACAAPLPGAAWFCGECGTAVPRAADTAAGPAAAVVTEAGSAREPERQPDPPPETVPEPEPAAEPEQPPEPVPLPEPPAGARFVLQFSTGESVTVTGTGLIGRNPRPEPGEHVDSLVTIADPGRTVSKTHLEFGQQDGEFWVQDRWSGNGTVLLAPDAAPRRCEPDRRIRVPRGSRLQLGDQFLVVS